MNYLRLKKDADFKKLFGRGKRVFSPTLTLIYFPSRTMQMGVAVSKKHGKAVKRNRIKRLLRAAFDKNCNLLEDNYTIVLLPKIAESYSFGSFEKSLKICLSKVNSCEAKAREGR